MGNRLLITTVAQMHSDFDDIELCFVHPDLEKASSDPLTVVTYFEAKFDAFDITSAQCYDPVQRDQLLGIIGAFPFPEANCTDLGNLCASHRGWIWQPCGLQQRHERHLAQTANSCDSRYM